MPVLQTQHLSKHCAMPCTRDAVSSLPNVLKVAMSAGLGGLLNVT